MALAIPGFNAAAVREGLRLPMRMGLPANEEQWPEFVIEAPVAATASTDAAGYPWDPSQPREEPLARRERPVCALEFEGAGTATQHFGDRQPGVVVITILDEEYSTIEGFSYVNIYPTLGGAPVKYFYRRVLERLALDAVEIWQIQCSTEDMS